MKSQQILSIFLILISVLYGSYNIDLCLKLMEEHKKYKEGAVLIVISIIAMIIGLWIAWIIRWTN